MTVIDEATAACESKLTLEDRAQYALALVDLAFVELHGRDPRAWMPGVQARYELAMDEVHTAYDAAHGGAA